MWGNSSRSLGQVLTRLAITLIAAGALWPAQAQQNDPLAEGFDNPPDAARPLAYWQWVNGNVSEEGIRLDLDWMARIGMGGVFMFDIGFGSPPIPQYVANRVGFGSDAWRSAVRLAAEDAERLNISFGMQSSGGWSVSGGPDVSPEDAMKKLVWSETHVTPDMADVALPPPPRTSGPFQDYPISERFREPALGGDIAIIAYRIPEFEESTPDVSGAPNTRLLSDGKYGEAASVSPDSAGRVSLTYTFAEPVAPDAFTLSLDGGVPAGVIEDERGAQRAVLPRPAQLASPVQTYDTSGPHSKVWRVTFENIGEALNIREARFHFGPRVNRSEEKAGFGTLADYDSERSGPVPARRVIKAADVLDVSSHMTPGGRLDWRPEEGHWIVTRFGWSLTGKRVVPAPAESIGFEVDKLDRDAVRRFAKAFYDRLLAAAGSDGRVDIALTDSWEAGAQNWSPHLRDEFIQRRGYDPILWFPVLTGRMVGAADASERFLADWRRTIADIVADNHYGVFQEELRARGITYYAEAPGTNLPMIADGIQAKRRVDVPTGEFWYWPEEGAPKAEHIADIREAASAAAIEGKSIVAAESLTSMGEVPWATGPREWRRMVDRFFAEGVTRTIMHTSAHQPFTDRYPGMTLRQYGQHFTRNEAWADLAEGWVSYLSRTSFLLQQGRPVRDVAIFYGADAAIAPPYGPALRPDGYDMDFLDQESLLQLAFVDGYLVTPGGARYRLLALRPGLERMNADTLRKLCALAEDGATILGDRPAGPLGLVTEDREFQTLANRLWLKDGTGRHLGKGRVYSNMSMTDVLTLIGVSPDLYSPAMPLNWTHRKIDDGDLYFVSNPAREAFRSTITVRAENAPPEARVETWDAATTDKASLQSILVPAGRTVDLSLPPYGSTFMLVRANIGPAAPAARVPTETLASIDGPWDVSFLDGRGAPAHAGFDTLASWTDHADPAIKYYSGRATYRTEFSLADAPPAQVSLDLGSVGEMARVRINGHDFETVWWSPTRLDVSGALKQGGNTIEIEVANYWHNRLVGDRQNGAVNYTFAPIKPYDANTPLRPSGLIGPVRLERLE